MSKLVSIIAPVYNEEDIISEFFERVLKAVRLLEPFYDFEFLIIDDGSRDRTLEILKGLIARDSRLRVLELRRNFGQTAALQAGFDAACGEIIVTLDADLQHLPEEIPAFIEKLEEGYDMVCGWRHRRKEGVFRRWPSAAANLILRKVTNLPFHDFGTTFRSYRTELTHELRLYGEFHRFIPALAYQIGARITEIPIKNVERRSGKSNYGLSRTFGVAMDIGVLLFFVRYIDRPMRAFGKWSTLSFLSGAVILAWMNALSVIKGNYPMFKEHPGWLLLGVLLIITSVQILFIGILAEILIRLHFGLGDRRVYKIRREWTASGLAPA